MSSRRGDGGRACGDGARSLCEGGRTLRGARAAGAGDRGCGGRESHLDLQGRIDAEQAMLENEQAKLTLLTRRPRRSSCCRSSSCAKLAIAGHGEFETRLHPLLP